MTHVIFFYLTYRYGVDGDRYAQYEFQRPAPFKGRPRIGARMFVKAAGHVRAGWLFALHGLCGCEGQQAGCSVVQQRARIPCGDVAVEGGSVPKRADHILYTGDIPECRVQVCVGLFCVLCSEVL